MNKTIAGTGALLAMISVLLFAVCMLISFDFGSYFVCMLLPIGYIMMTAGFCAESDEKHCVAAKVGMAFAIIYAVLIFLVYFAQTTSVRFDSLDERAMKILDYSRGVFFFSCFLMPMTGIFSSMQNGGVNVGGVIALEIWCAYFIPIGILSWKHFRNYKEEGHGQQ